MFWNISKEKCNWVEEIFSQMGIDEKIGQLICERDSDLMQQPDPYEWMCKNPVGSLFVGSEIIQEGAEGSELVQKCLKKINSSGNRHIPMLVCGDFEHGIGRSIEGYTRLPDFMALSAAHDPALAYEYGRIIAQEGSSLGLHWGFGPVSDLNTNHCCFVANTRTAGDNPQHAISMLKEVVRGMQENGMAACPKHFPGDGTDARNQHIVTSLNLLSRQKWKRMHGKVFQTLIDNGAASIMIGHMGFPAYEKIDSRKGIFRPATASKKIMTDLLRGEMGFKGIILTDALCMNGFICWGSYEERMIDSFNGGTDVFLWPGTEKFTTLMKNALDDGRTSIERLDESVRRILMFKAWLGLDHPQVNRKLTEPEKASNRKTARYIAEKSITLLRNRAKTLPLDLSEGAELLLAILPETDQAAKPLDYFAEHLIARGYKVTMIKLTKLHTLDTSKFEAAFLLCNSKPLYIKYPINDYSIWGFMSDEKIRKRIFISFGTPYFLYEISQADNYMNVYSDSRESIDAAVKVLFGELPSAGLSPVAMPYCFKFGDGV
jgi:beta-N-acetylhexosaminidase